MFWSFAHSTNFWRAFRQLPNLWAYVEGLNFETSPERSLVLGCLPSVLQTRNVATWRAAFLVVWLLFGSEIAFPETKITINSTDGVSEA
jgi:hypothetical protein